MLTRIAKLVVWLWGVRRLEFDSIHERLDELSTRVVELELVVARMPEQYSLQDGYSVIPIGRVRRTRLN